MKILLITDGVQPYRKGGMPRLAFHLSRNLPLVGANLTVLHCVPEGEKMISEEEYQQLIFPDGKGKVNSVCIPFPKNHKFPGHYIYESKLFSKWAYEKIKNRLSEFDFIYAKGFTGYYFLKNKNKNMPPVFVQLHGLEMFQKTWSFKSKLENISLRPIAKYCLRNADFIFSYAGDIEKKIIELGVDPKKIYHQYGCVPQDRIAEKIKNTGEIIRFVFTPRNERRKGIPEFHQALKGILKSYSNFHVDIIGPIPEKYKIIDNKITYHGQIDSEEKYYNIISACDVVVLPSISEGFPLVTLEAMARGLTAIANDVGAVSVLVNNENGWLIPPTIKDLQGAFISVLNTPKNVIDNKKILALESMRSKFIWPVQCTSIIEKAQNAILKHKN